MSDSVEDIEKDVSTCDSTHITCNVIQPIIENNCYRCHQTEIAEAGIVLDSYSDLRNFAESGQLLGAVMHSDGFTPMPLDAEKLSECELAKIKNWIDNGTPE